MRSLSCNDVSCFSSLRRRRVHILQKTRVRRKLFASFALFLHKSVTKYCRYEWRKTHVRRKIVRIVRAFFAQIDYQILQISMVQNKRSQKIARTILAQTAYHILQISMAQNTRSQQIYLHFFCTNRLLYCRYQWGKDLCAEKCSHPFCTEILLILQISMGKKLVRKKMFALFLGVRRPRGRRAPIFFCCPQGG